MTKRKPKSEHGKDGQPTKYKKEYAKMAFVACSDMGAKDTQLSELFSVSISTIKNWKKEHLEFLTAIKEGKDVWDTLVVEGSLNKRANGFKYDEVTKTKVPIKDEEGVITGYEMAETKRVTKQIVPDTTAQIFWLKNRNRERWSDHQNVVIKDESEIQTPNEVLRRLAFMLRNKEETK